MTSADFSLFLPDEAATLSLAARLADSLKMAALQTPQPLMVYLNGDLGSGKTTFVRGFLRARGFSGNVKSPTYNLLESYALGALAVLHFDLYRFSDPQEWEEAGFDDVLSPPALVFVEWAACAAGFVPPPDLTLSFSVQETGRMCTILPNSATGRDVFSLWQSSPDGKY